MVLQHIWEDKIYARAYTDALFLTEQIVAPVDEYEPAVQATGRVAASMHWEPAGHTVQLTAPDPAAYMPDGHGYV